MSDYYHNENTYCSKCNKLRYMGHVDKSSSELCICSDQDNIPIVIKYNELGDSELLYASEEDWAFFNKCIEGLPIISGRDGIVLSKNGDPIPYGSGPHILRWFRETIEIVNPKNILEIGFNVGYGSAMLLELSNAYVFSCDIDIKRVEILDACGHLHSKYKERFEFTYRQLSAFEYIFKHIDFDLCFIDGGHEEIDVIADIQLCLKYKIPYLLFDDIYNRFGPGVLPAISKFPELELVKDMNNLRLYKVNYEHS